MWVVETTSLVGRCLDSSRVMRMECYAIELKARTPEIESRGCRYICNLSLSFLTCEMEPVMPICQNLGMTSHI